MYIDGTDISCGTHQLIGVETYTPKEVLISAIIPEITENLVDPDWYYDPFEEPLRLPAFYIFSDVYEPKKPTGGQALANYIIKHKLGTIHQSNVRVNKNSGNRIRVWIWSTPPKKVLLDWKKQEEEKEKKKDERKSSSRRRGQRKLA
jgi:hypothetical protein